MDLQLYFDPPDFDRFQTKKRFSRQTLGFHIEKATKSIKDGGTGKATIALAGVPLETGTENKGTAKAPDEIRKYLYSLSNLDTSQKIIDLGNLKSGKNPQDSYFALRDVTDYLIESGVILVVLGGGQDLGIGICRAFRNQEGFTLTVADARVDVKSQREPTGASNFITRILKENPALFHLQMLGVQQHYVSPQVFGFLQESTYDCYRLGDFREDNLLAESLLRNSHFLSFDISSIKKSDAPGHYRPSPNGFYSEEACLIARFAGLSHRLKVFGLFEVNPVADKSGATTELAAQMVWYFLDGAVQRRKEDPAVNKAAFTRYFVEMEDHGEPLVFYYQPATNRWWIELFPEEGKSWVVACKERDYRQAISQEIPDIYLKYVRKTIRLSK
jgi:formiminoglutamase